MGMAVTRVDERISAAVGMGGNAQPAFGNDEAVCGAGVLFLLPALLEQGLLKTKEVYRLPDNHYYGLVSVVLTLAFMALSRIKNPEQLKQCKPGEIGKIIGLDRSPEVKCLRDKIKLLSSQKQAQRLNRLLVDDWYRNQSEENLFLYIDGHVRIYHGSQANLPAKFVSRQKLCLNATTEFWVNDPKGMPVMMVTGELTEKLAQSIENLIIPQLQKTNLLPAPGQGTGGQQVVEHESGTQDKSITPEQQQKTGNEKADDPQLTLVFDREGYDIPFFKRLWDSYRIAILTYRKNVRDNWPEDSFESIDVTVLEVTVKMQICEQKVTLGGMALREIRRLTDSGHQTSIITNNQLISTAVAAGRMFGRWSQENFFRYMVMDYDFDKMIEYGVQPLDEKKDVVNPQYRKLNHKLKKEKEKTARLEAKLLRVAEESVQTELDKLQPLLQKESNLMEKINQCRVNQQQTLTERDKLPPRITLKEMSDNTRYDQLKPESKMLMNIIRMICYRAETAVANILSEYTNNNNEKRMLVKNIIETNADIVEDRENKTLTVTLHSLSANRFNEAAAQLAEVLNQTETIFPDTELKLIFKYTAT
jgi:hypothetical protein